MAKFSQKIVLFIEPAARAWSTPSKIANLYMNRFAIDEDENHEILKIYQLEKWDIIRRELESRKRDSFRRFEGLDLID